MGMFMCRLCKKEDKCSCSEEALKEYDILKEDYNKLDTELSCLYSKIEAVIDPANREILNGKCVVDESLFQLLFKKISSENIDYSSYLEERYLELSIIAEASSLFIKESHSDIKWRRTLLEKLEILRKFLEEHAQFEMRKKEKLGLNPKPEDPKWKLHSPLFVIEKAREKEATKRSNYSKFKNYSDKEKKY